ncbi:MAG TPA: SMC-Scp complex subunit ScpB [Candidatus Angelobacter sp.]|nr:SMC-Scp complex subunit ScpB [Candidatus Angelobacter sp.]
MPIKPKLEALIYAAEDPISLDQMAALLKDDLLAEMTALVPETVEEPAEATEPGAEPPSGKRTQEKSEKAVLRALLKPHLEELIAEFNQEQRGIEIRQVAGGYRMSTKPEHHDVVRAFAKSLKPPIRLSLQALETLAVIAYKQPVTVPEISEIRGVDCGGVIATLVDRKLITTAGRKAVIGRPIQYKTTKDFLLRFGLKDVGDLPSIEEFEKIATSEMQEEAVDARDTAIPDATGVPDDGEMPQTAEEHPGEMQSAEAQPAEEQSAGPSAEETAVAPQDVHVHEHAASADLPEDGNESSPSSELPHNVNEIESSPSSASDLPENEAGDPVAGETVPENTEG